MFPKRGTAQFDEFIHEMEELFQFLTDYKECFRRAETCEQRAKLAAGKNKRSALLKLAGHWRDLGIHYEIKTKFPIEP